VKQDAQDVPKKSSEISQLQVLRKMFYTSLRNIPT
jgi:hypothetical protein